MRVLVVDDDVTSALLIERKVSNHLPQAEVRVVHSGRECLQVLSDETFDLLILDYLLPDLDGLEVLHYLEQNHERRRPPVIFITAYGNENVAVEALRAGADFYVHKTDLPYVIEAVIDKVMERREESRKVSPAEEMTATHLAAESRILRLINSHHDIRIPFGELQQEIAALIPLDCLSIGLISPDGRSYCIHARAGKLPQERNSGTNHLFSEAGACIPLQLASAAPGESAAQDPLREALSKEAPVILKLQQNEPQGLFAAMYRDGIRSCGIFPLRQEADGLDVSGRAVFGSLNAASAEPDFFTPPRVRVLSALALHIALSLANQRRALLEGLTKAVATLQHVTNNALAAIVGNAELLLLSDKVRLPDRVHAIVDASMRISGCLHELNSIRDPLLERTTFGGMEFLDVRDYLSGKTPASPKT
jgi:DNA-binding response OmpR family regulator